MAESTTPPNSSQPPLPPPSPMIIDGSDHDLALASSQYLTRREVLQRRSRRVKQLARIYKDHYWALMEELKGKYREYYWTFGKSPFKENEKNLGVVRLERIEENGKVGGCSGGGDDIRRCEVNGCKEKAMALTKYCHSHILSDSKQRLYKGCTFVIMRYCKDVNYVFDMNESEYELETPLQQLHLINLPLLKEISRDKFQSLFVNKLEHLKATQASKFSPLMAGPGRISGSG